MANPSVTARVAPSGIMLEDGYPTTVAFAKDPNVCIWEKSVTPPGIDGGDPINTTTMHNTARRTCAARSLISATPGKMTVGYDPDAYDEIAALVNVEGSITYHFPDGSTYAFFGFLQKFDPKELKEGGEVEADVTIIETDWDPVNRVEAGPLMTEVAGT